MGHIKIFGKTKIEGKTVFPPPPLYDSTAAAYIAAVEAADGQALESSIKTAYNDFIVGCKSDGIWSAIKASCILAGARTLSGALVPIVGSAPTNNNFVSVDYSRTIGLLSNGTTKHLNTNRRDNDDPRDSHHFAVYNTTSPSPAKSFGGVGSGATNLNNGTGNAGNGRCRSNSIVGLGTGASVGFKAIARESSLIVRGRANGTNYQTLNQASTAPVTSFKGIFTRYVGSIGSECDCRISFYSMGESLDLAKLDARVSTLMTAINAAI
jgi:hypothetical protein